LREGKKKEKGMNCLRWRKGKSGWNVFIPRPGSHPRAERADGPQHPRRQSATPPQTIREARGWSGPQARTVRYCFQNAQCCTFAQRATRTVRAALADSPPGVARRSALLLRTVRTPLLISA
jgi:hypothetical protein